MRSLKLPSFRRDADRPTLKQRAATLKATAARLMRKPAPVAPTSAPETPEAVDWHNPPPSFMAFPAIEPGGFVRIERGLSLEIDRLLGIARGELARRMFRPVPGETEADRQRREADHRARLLIPALTAAADPDSAEAGALAALDAAADVELIALGRQYDALHAVWREAEEAGRELFARRDAALAVASAGNADPIKAHEAAWALPGVREAYDRAEKALVALDPICEAIRVQPARTLAGLAVKARANICETWSGGDFELSAGLGDNEDSPMRGVRNLIEACCAAAGVDWQGRAQGRTPAEALRPGLSDAELIALGHAFDLAVVREREAAKGEDDGAEAIDQETRALVRRIVHLPAHTAEGMHAKLRVAAFYGVGDPDTPEGDAYPGGSAIRSLYRDTPGIIITSDPIDIRLVPEASVIGKVASSLFDQIIACWREWAACCGPDETDADRAAWERVTERRDALLDAAEALPPTLENLPAKALALAWLDYVQEWERGREREAYDIPGSLAVDIDTAIVGRFRLVGHFRGA